MKDYTSDKTSIPILNIYYLLCYAWDKLDEGEKVEVSSSGYEELINLLSRVLINGCHHLFRRGLDKTYQEYTDVYNGIKGKIQFKASLNKNLFRQGKAVCTFDEFNANNLQNQIIKATLLRIMKTYGAESEVKHLVWDNYLRFQGVDDLEIQTYHFSQVRIHKNNSFYDFILRLCYLILENTVLDENSDSYSFKDFIGDEKQFAYLFENFVRNFYKKEQKQYTVRRENIRWDVQALDGSSEAYLPKMETDITLESPNRKIIIETKYYINALSSRYDAGKFHSHNLYQLYSYLKNLEHKPDHALNPSCEGILLYPANNYTIDQHYIIQGHKISVKTIDLNLHWQEIKGQLLAMLE